MGKIMAFICLASLAFVIGSAGALELSLIGLGQGIMQMGGGLAIFATASRWLRK